MARGNHSDLLSDRGPWYSTRSKDYLTPSITGATEEFPFPAPEFKPKPIPGRHRKKGPPRRRANPRIVTAAVFTAILAVPALWMADYIATHEGKDPVPIELVNRNAYMPMTLYADGGRTPICVFVMNSSQGWKAWATTQPC